MTDEESFQTREKAKLLERTETDCERMFAHDLMLRTVELRKFFDEVPDYKPSGLVPRSSGEIVNDLDRRLVGWLAAWNPGSQLECPN
ncbi:MAG TPA: hypothetical protein VEI98_06580 [Xanthobacteraceae bacterium]|nr:hypothetical protein [Xanthobacteraceae bacterium]